MTTFLIIGVVGLILLAISLLVGDLFDGVLDALAGDFFSSAVIGGFVAALGFAGAIAQSAGEELRVQPVSDRAHRRSDRPAIGQLTVISTDGAGALPKRVTDNMVQTMSMLKASTGLDLEKLIQRPVTGAVTGPGASSDGRTSA